MEIMRKTVFEKEAHQLQNRIELEESKYKRAIQSGKKYKTLKRIRTMIRELKRKLWMIRERRIESVT
jgi:hypothetical protein